jgi:ATP-dependent RNA helicase DHX37/DHR1
MDAMTDVQVFSDLAAHQLEESQLSLMLPLHQRGARETKRQKLGRLLRLERAGVVLPSEDASGAAARGGRKQGRKVDLFRERKRERDGEEGGEDEEEEEEEESESGDAESGEEQQQQQQQEQEQQHLGGASSGSGGGKSTAQQQEEEEEQEEGLDEEQQEAAAREVQRQQLALAKAEAAKVKAQLGIQGEGTWASTTAIFLRYSYVFVCIMLVMSFKISVSGLLLQSGSFTES